MAASVVVNRTRSFFNDLDEIGVFDPGDGIYHRVVILNNGTMTLNNVTLTDVNKGQTLVAGTLNISPLASNDSFTAVANTVLRVGGAGTIGAGESISVAGNLLSNDRGSSTVGTGVIAGDSVAGFQIDTVASGTSAKGGIFNIFSDGSFNYVNDGNDTEADLAAGDTFTYTIRDAGLDGVIGNADDLTSAATVTINFALQGAAGSPVHRVWFVDGNATVDGTGTSVSPLRTSQVQASLNNASDRDGSGQTIYIKNSVTASLQLENGQSLIGTGAALNVGGFAVASAGSNSTITSASGSTVSLADGNTVSGINIANSSTASTALSGVAVGALTINGVAVNASGAAINLSSGSIAGTGFTTVTSTSATAFNVRFSNVSGAIDLGTGALSGAANASLSIASGSPLDLSLSYAGTITQSNNAAAVSVSGGGVGITGTLTLTGAINATNGTGLQFSNADGTYNILGNTSLSGGDAGIDIGFGSSGTFNFGSAGTGTTTTITSPTGTGLSVDDNTATINYRGNITQANNAAAVNVNNHSAGTITFHSGTINATNGTGLQFSNADGTYNFNGITNLNGGDAGIDIVNGSGGVFTFGTSTSLTNASGTNFNVNGGGGNITFNGTINDTNGQLIAITGRTGGVIDFNGLVTDLVNANDGGGIAITGNTGGTVRFDGGVQLRTSSGVNAFVATGNPGMALVITDPAGATANQITATNGIALNVADTTIGAGGLVFESISASGGASGIILNTTGSTAGLTVTGSGGINSGGTILGATDAGIILTSTGPVSLTDYRVQSGADDGIRGNVVNGLTLTRASILANGNAVAERGLDMTDLRGVVNITNSTFTGSADDNVYIRNTGGSLNLTVTGSTFSANSATTGNDGLIIIGSGTGTSGGLITANISNNSFTNNRGDHFQYSTEGAASNLVFTTNITFANNTLTNPQGSATVGAGPTLGGGITVNPGGAHQTTIDINANTITNSVVSAINVQNTTNSTAAGNLNATIRNNTIGSAANNISGSHQAFGIQLEAKGAGTVTAAVTNNVVNESQDYAMFVQANDGNGVLNLTATGNTLRPDLNDPNFGREAFYVNAGSSSNNVFGQIDSHTVRLDLGGAGALRNILAGGPNGVGDYWIRQRIGTRVELAGGFNNGGNPFDGVAVQNFLNPRNLNATGAANATGSATAQNNATITTDGYHSTVGAVPTPPLPSQPLTAAAMAPDPQPELAPAGEPELIEIVEQQPQVVDDLPPAGTDAAPVPVAAASDQAPVIVDDGVLSQAELDFIVEAAIARWQAAGATPEQIATMRAVSVSVADLASLQVGQSLAGAIQLDGDAAGWRWFIDATPGADEEFDGAGTQLAARDWLGAAGTRIDLLTVVMHELGHQIGLTDAAAPGATDALMYGAITAGERRLPGVGDAAGVVPGAAPVNGALAVGPLSLGALAPGQSLTIEWRTTVDGPGEDRLTGAIVNQTSLSTTELTVQTSAADAQAIDSVRLGDRIFLDANKNGVFDAGDTGIAGVKLTLFADTNDNGLFDAGDRAIMFEDVNSNGSYDVGVDTPMPAGSTGANIVALTATTDSSGLYSFSNLAPGDYLVRVDASNFTTGGALVGRKVFATSSDPNNNVDGDNNGQDFTTFVASRAIRLDYGLETSAGPTGGASDTNNSLDMAFIQPNQAPSFTAPAFAIERVSTTSAGAQATGGSGTGSSGAAFSQTGNKIAFISAASNLVAGDANGQPDAFVKDLTTGVVTLASTSTAGVQANSSSGLVALSPDGTKVAFVSSASNLVAGDNNNAQDLFVKDLTTGVTTRVSVSTTNGDPNSTSGSPVFSPDGTKIAFSSAATNLVAGDTNSAQDIFVRDLVNNTTTRVSTTGAQGQANGFSGNVVFSPDGIQIAFTSAASNLVAGDTNGQQDVFVKNLVSGDVFRVSTTAAGGEAVGGLSSTPVFSPDGTKIAFQSFATNLVAGDTNGSLDIFVKDLNTNAVTRVSTDSAGVQANAGSSADPDFSPDGTKVVFQSLATNLVTGDTNGTFDVFVKDLITGLTTRVSTSAAGVQGNNSSLAPAFSPDGRIAFESSASNLVANDTNTQQDIFLATLGNGATTYTENGAPLAVATVVNVGDADSASYANGTFSAGITAGSVAGDLLTLASSGGASGINVVGSSVRFNNVEIGTLTSTATSLSVALNASSTDAAVKALAEAVRISSTSESPTAATRTVTFTLVDGGGTADSGQDTASFTRDVAFVPVNDAPAGADNSVSINEDTSRTFSAADFGFTDVDGNAFAGVVITTLPANGSILVNGTAIAAGAFVTAAQLAANQVTFVPTANFNGSASFTFQVRDDGATGGANQNTDQTPNTLTINVAAVNDAPTVSIQSPGAIVASGGEFLVNTTTGSNQAAPAVTALTSGGFVVTWTDFSLADGDSSTSSIKAQVFNAAGAKVGSEFLVNMQTAGGQDMTTVTGLSNGGFVISWRDSNTLSDGSSSSVKAQIYDAAGAQVGGEFLVNTQTANAQENPNITALSTGGFIVTWEDSSGQGGDASLSSVKGQLFSAAGAKIGGEILLNTSTLSFQIAPAVAGVPGGGFVVAWADGSGTGGDNDSYGIKYQLFDSSGAKVGAERLANTTILSAQYTPEIASSSGGGFMIVWRDESGFLSDGSAQNVRGQLFDAAGAKIGTEILVNTTTADTQFEAKVAALPQGGYLVAWSDRSGASDISTGVKAQQFDGTGARVGSEFRVNTTLTGEQRSPALATLTSGNVVISWQDFGLTGGDSSGSSIKAQLYTPPTSFDATEQVALSLKGSITVADVDAGGGTLTATLSVGHGILNVTAGGSGATIVSGNGTGSVVVSGTLAQLNALLRTDATSTVTYTPDTDNPPASTQLTVSVNDNGNSGTGGAQTGSNSATIAITAVNDAPAGADNSVSINEDTSRTFSAADFGFTDVDGNAFAGVVITTLPAAGTLSLNGVAVTAGQLVTAAQLSANQLVFTPAANANGNGYASFTFQVRDNGSTANGGVDTDPTPNTLTFNVTAVNDAPTVSFLPLLAPVGGEARVNTTTAGDQVQPAAAALALGGYVVTWATTGGGIYAQRYNDNGTPAGGEILVGTGDVQAPGVVGFVELPGFTWPGRGGFAVSWNDTSGNVLLRRYDASGNPLAAASVVANSDGIFTSSAIMAFPGGATLVAWVGKGSQNTAEIFGRYFNTEGTPAGAAFKISTSNAASQLNPAVLRLPDGGWVASWTSNDGNFNEDIRAQRYDVNGNQAGGEFVVNTYTTSGQADPAMAALAGGGFVVVWRSFGQDGSLFGIYGQRFNADGTRAGGEFLVNTQTNSSQAQPTVAGLASGGFVVSWTSLDQDGDGSGVFAQNFDAFGARVGGEFRVNSVTAGNQNQSALATLPSGDLVVAWTSSGQDGSGTSIQAQRFSSALLATEQQTSDLKGRIAVADVDAGSGTLTATLSVGHGILNVTAGGSGATIVSGNGTGSVVVSGTLAQLNALLRTDGVSTITYTADTDNPPASTTFSVSVNDNGNGPAGSNLLVNGGFETQDGVNVTRDYIINGPGGVAGTANGAYFRTSGTLFGWQLAGGLEFDLETNFNNANFNTGDGTSLIDMERGAGENLSFFQDVSGIAAGTALRIGFAAALPVEYGPGQSASVAVQVYWNGALVGTVSPTSATMANFFFDVTAAASGTGAGGANRLQFIEIGNGGNDGRGTQLDAVSLRALNPQTGSSSSAIAIAAVNDAPAGVDSSGNVLDNATLTFTAASFATGMTDPEGHAFAGVRVTTLPTAGTLLLNGAAITVVNTDVTLAQLNAGQLTYQPAAGSGNTAPTFTFQVRDNGGTANGGVDLDQSPNTFTVNVAASNVAPVIDLDGTAAGTGTSVTIIENQSGNVAPNATVTDVDSANFNGGTLTVGYAAGGTASDVITVQDQGGATVSNNRIGIVGNYVFFNQVQIGTITTQGPGNGLVVTFNSAATPAAVQQLVRTVYADTLSDTPPAGARTLTFTVTDGAGGSANAAAAVTIPASNDAPTATNIAGDTVTITEPAGAATASPVRLDAGGNATIADVDNANFAGGSLTVAVTAGGASQEQLLLLTTGEGAGQIGSSGNAVRFGGTQFATFSGGLNTPLVFTFDANATPAAVQALIRNVAYFNMGGDFPVAGARTVSWSLVDGGGVANQGVDTLAFTTSVNVVASNDIPILTQPPTQNVSFTEQGPRTLLMQGVTVNDSDQPANFQGGSLSLSVTGPDGMIIPRLGSVIRTTANGDGTFVLALQEGQTQVVIGTITGLGTLNVQVTGLNTNATTTRINNLIDEFAFAVSGDTPTGGLRTVTLVMNDGGNVGGGPLTSTVVQQLEVIPVDDAPVAGPDGFTTTETASVSGTLFSNDSDVDGPALSVAAVNGNAAAVGQQIALASGARLTVNANGTFTYNPNGAFDHLPPASSGASNSVATDSFTYTLAGGTPVTVTLTINGEANGNNIIFGSAAGEGLFGGAGNDQIFGLDGDDFAQGLGGNDYIEGGNGADSLYGGDGIDTVVGAAGNDQVYGEAGDDTLYGQDGDDYLDGGAARDLLLGGLGRDVLAGGAGEDSLYGQEGDDELYGQDGNDLIDGGVGRDFLLGGTGLDLLVGGADNDALYGQDDADELYGQAGDDYLDGGAGADLLLGGAGADGLAGGDGNDSLYGQDGDDEIYGLVGDDLLDGGAGRDFLLGGAGLDLLVGGADNDRLFGQEDDDELHGQDGDDYLDGGAGRDRLFGGVGADGLVGALGDDQLFGQEGDDQLYGQEGSDYLDGGAGLDLLIGGLGRDLLVGGADNDTLLGQEDGDELYGQAGDDYLDGGDGADLLFGGLGVDLVLGGAGDDAVYGQEGNDELHGQDGNDFMDGGAGADTFFGGAGNDLLFGGAGADRLFGGTGADMFVFNAAGESAVGAADQIFDFNAAEGDKINLSGIDADTRTAATDPFTFIGTGAFTNKAGELRYEIQNGQAHVFGDVNGDGIADFQIIVNAGSLTVDNFLGVVPAAGI